MFRNITTRIIGVVAVLMLSLCLGTSALADGQAGTVTGNLVNMRRGPGTQYARVQYLNKGDTVTVTDQNGSWYAVTVNGTDGYVYSNYVSVSAAAGTPAAPAASSSATLRRGSTGSARSARSRLRITVSATASVRATFTVPKPSQIPARFPLQIQ